MKKNTLLAVIIFLAGLFNYIHAQQLPEDTSIGTSKSQLIFYEYQKVLNHLEGQINPSSGELPRKTPKIIYSNIITSNLSSEQEMG